MSVDEEKAVANSIDESNKGPELGRRAFLGAATLGTGAALAGGTAMDDAR